MTKLKIIKTFSLSDLGDEWKDCYLKFGGLTYNEWQGIADIADKAEDPAHAKEVAEVLMNFLKKKFVEGTGIGEDGKEVKLKASDLGDLPLETLGKAVSFLSGSPLGAT